jgi:hypothetical protein
MDFGGYRCLSKGLLINKRMQRPLCPTCHGNPVAINYYSKGKVRYRKQCSSCARQGKRGRQVAGWLRAGYKKKLTCERCGFKAKHKQQMFVFYVDGNLKNNNWINLKSVCANCRIELQETVNTWVESPLSTDQ